MSKEYSYSKGVILFSITRKIELLNKRNDEVNQELTDLEVKKTSLCKEINRNDCLIDSLMDLKDLIDNDDLLPLPPNNISFDFYKDEIPFPDDGLPF